MTRNAALVMSTLMFGSIASAQDDGESVVFRDVSAAAGIDFEHTNGRSGELYVIEVKGSGAAFLDYDEDGDLDLYAVNGNNLPGAKTDTPPINRLYRNDGNGSFTDVTDLAGVGDGGYGHGVAAADYDRDGDQDLYVLNYGPNVLYRNDGDGTFTDVTAAAGVAGDVWSASAAFCDLNNDGYLDLYVANYLVFDIESTVRLPTGPVFYEGEVDVLYLNNGDGSFRDVTRENVGNPNGKGLGVVCFDKDGDRDLDIYVTNDGTVNLLYENDGTAVFRDLTLFSGTGVNGAGQTEAGMGVDAGDYDNDGDLDLFVTNYKGESNTLMRNDGGGVFTDTTLQANLVAGSLPYVTFGAGFFDYDNDGDLDLFVANGHTEETRPDHEQPDQLFENLGDGRYEEVSAISGAPFTVRHVGRGVAFGDFDNDGDVDLVVSNKNGRLALLQNQGGNRKNWLAVRTRGTRSNRDGIGATVTVSAEGFERIKDVKTAYSMFSSNDPRIHFGLGHREQVSLEVRWPSGTVDRIDHVSANKLVTIVEGSSEARIDAMRPIQTDYSDEALAMVSENESDSAAVERSVQQLRALLSAGSDDLRAYLRLGGDFVRWIERYTRLHFNELLARDPERFDVLVEYGGYLQFKLDDAEAIRVIERATRVAPDPAPMQARLASLKLRMGHYVDAVAAARSAQALGDGSPAVYLRLAQGLAGLDRREEAQAVLEEMVVRHPRAVEGHLELGRVYLDGGSAERAVEAYRSAVAMQPGQREWRYQLAEAHRRAGDEQAYSEQMEIFDVLETESDVFKGGMEPAEEIDLLHRELRRDPLFGHKQLERMLVVRFARLGDEENEELFSLRGRASWLKEDIAGEVDALRRTLQLDPNPEWRAEFNIVNDLRLKLVAALNRGAGYDLTTAVERVAAARAALARGDYDDALTGFKSALVEDPESLPAYQGLIELHLMTGFRLDLVTRLAHRAARIDQSAESYELLARTYRATGDEASAVRFESMAVLP